MLLLMLLLLVLLVSGAVAAGVLGVDRVLNRSFSIDGLLSDGELLLLVEVTSLLDLHTEFLSQGTLDVDGPLGSVPFSADALEGSMLVLGFEGSLKPLLVLVGNVDVLFLAGGAGGTRRVLLVALAAAGGVRSIIIRLFPHLNGFLYLGDNDQSVIILSDDFNGPSQLNSGILIRQFRNSNDGL
jgi:hypothetical protein